MSKYVETLVARWADDYAAEGRLEERDKLRETLRTLDFMERRSYHQYEPSRPPNPSYWQRMENWLMSAGTSSINQRLMFELASHLFFVGAPEIEALHKAAFGGPVVRWLVQQGRLDLRAPNLTSQLNALVAKTWFCPITDSMKINEFVHLNAIHNGINERPDFLTQARTNAATQIQGIIDRDGIERLVLLEDFIATGSQARKAIQFAAKLTWRKAPLPVLVVPLILCETLNSQFQSGLFSPNVSLSPVLILERKHFVDKDTASNSPTMEAFRQLAERTFATVTSGKHSSRTQKPYHHLGYGKTGGLVVLKTNSPDNTLPLVHWSSDNWEPLFPRHSRV